MSQNEHNGASEVKTTSRLQAWWLQAVKKYELKTIVRSSPQPGLFGGIKYHTIWILQGRGNGERT